LNFSGQTTGEPCKVRAGSLAQIDPNHLERFQFTDRAPRYHARSMPSKSAGQPDSMAILYETISCPTEPAGGCAISNLYGAFRVK